MISKPQASSLVCSPGLAQLATMSTNFTFERFASSPATTLQPRQNTDFSMFSPVMIIGLTRAMVATRRSAGT